MASHGRGGEASDQEIVGLMADAERLHLVAVGAARDAEIAAQMARGARLALALRAMSRTNEEERGRLYVLGQTLTPDMILNWASAEAVSTSRGQRRRWRLFRVLQMVEQGL